MKLEGTSATIAKLCTPRAWLFVILLLAVALRLYGIARPVWYDEILLWDISKESFTKALTHTSYPLAYVLSHLSLFLGQSASMLRMPSFIAGIMGIWMIYRVGKLLHSDAAGLLAAFLLTICATHLIFSQEARFYSLLTAAAIMTLWATLLALSSGRLFHWMLLGSAVAFGSLTHNFFMIFLFGLGAAMVCLFLYQKPLRARDIRSRTIAWAVCVITGFIPAAVCIAVHRLNKPNSPTILPDQAERFVFRLDPLEYVTLLRRLMSNYPMPVFLVLVGFGLFGVFALWRINKFHALICFLPLVLAPIPLYYISFRHWFSERYFMTMLPLMLLLMAIGMVSAFRSARKYAGLTAPVAVSLVLALPMLLEPGFWPYSHINTRRKFWLYDWAELTGQLAGNTGPEDRLIHVDRIDRIGPWIMGRRGIPTEWWEFNRYMLSLTPEGRAPVHPIDYSGVLYPDDIYAELQAHPFTTTWMVLDKQDYSQLPTLLRKVFSPGIDTPGYRLYSAGKPTTNLVISDVENGTTAFSEKFEHRASGSTTKSISLRATPYMLRNSSFEVWENNSPVGWTCNNVDSISSGPANQQGTSSLVIQPTTTTVVIEQQHTVPLAPGNRVSVTAQATASSPDTLSLGLKYAAPGGAGELRTTHPGNLLWQPLLLSAKVPENAFPESIRVFIKCEASSGSTSSTVDDVKLEMLKPCPLLELTAYSFSARVKYNSHGATVSPGVLGLSGTRKDGSRFWRSLIQFSRPSDWQRLALSVRVADDPDLAEATQLTIDFAAGDEKAELRLNQVQFEAGSHSTPYTRSERLPHDETLALMQYSPAVTRK
ncbi:MAG: glycosyltransferase family 39 protein [Candidatus Sumerlaeaceae bacterium]